MTFITHDQFDIEYWKSRKVPFTGGETEGFYDFYLEGRWPDAVQRDVEIAEWKAAKMRHTADAAKLVRLSGEGVAGLNALLHKGEADSPGRDGS